MAKTQQKKNNKKEKASNKKKKEKQPTKKLTKEDKQLRNFFIIIGIVVLFIAGFYIFMNSPPQFEYKGIEFTIVEQGDLFLYKTLIPLYDSQGEQKASYRFYLRNHPDELKDIPVPEELELKKRVVFNYSDEIVCEGKGNIALANTKQLYKVLGAMTWESSKVNETYQKCDEQGRYNYLNIRKGNNTEIIKKGPACYDLVFKDCEVLDVTERYMLKMFVQTKDKKVPVSNIQDKA